MAAQQPLKASETMQALLRLVSIIHALMAALFACAAIKA
jgi:hypothetical protein